MNAKQASYEAVLDCQMVFLRSERRFKISDGKSNGDNLGIFIKDLEQGVKRSEV